MRFKDMDWLAGSSQALGRLYLDETKLVENTHLERHVSQAVASNLRLSYGAAASCSVFPLSVFNNVQNLLCFSIKTYAHIEGVPRYHFETVLNPWKSRNVMCTYDSYSFLMIPIFDGHNK